MPSQLVEISASIRLSDNDDHIDAYIVTAAGRPCCVASLLVFSAETCPDVWREEFRALAQHIAEEKLYAQGFKPAWVSHTQR